VAGSETIGEWSISQLLRFIDNRIAENEVSSPVRTLDSLTVGRMAIIEDEIKFEQYQTTVGAAGTASALPANPHSYIKILDRDGLPRVVPIYNAS